MRITGPEVLEAMGRVEDGKRAGGMVGRLVRGSLAGVFAVLVLAAIMVPVLLNRGAPARDAKAGELLVSAAVRMSSCASLEGAYAGCDAREMNDDESGIEWRDGLAVPGWGLGRVGKVYVSELSETSYRLETTSGSGKVHSYVYQNDAVWRTAGGGGPETGW